MAEQPAIVASGLGKRFGQLQALTGVDLQVPAGAVVALLGPNGAGKTTTVRILSTLLPPDAGRAQATGLDVVRQAAAVRRVIGLSGQYAAVDAYLTGRENMRMIGRLSGLGRGTAGRRADELLELFGLAGAAARTARTYSGGMRRRLDVAAALVAAPRVLFLDEPITGLDPRGHIGLWALLAELAAQRTSLLLTTQYLEEADRLADAIVVIDAGKVIAARTPAQLKDQAGGDRLEIQALPGDDLAALAAALAGPGSSPAVIDCDAGRLVIPVAGGPGILPEVAARLAAACLQIADLALRRPTLDGVFLTSPASPARHPAPCTPAAGPGATAKPARRPPGGHREQDDHQRSRSLAGGPRQQRLPIAAGQHRHSDRPQPAPPCPCSLPHRFRDRAAGHVRAAVHLCLRRRDPPARGDPLRRLPAAWHLRARHRLRRLPDRRRDRRRPGHGDDGPVPGPAHGPLRRASRAHHRRRHPQPVRPGPDDRHRLRDRVPFPRRRRRRAGRDRPRRCRRRDILLVQTP